MVVYFLLSGLLAVFTEWYNSGRAQPIEQKSEQLSLLVYRWNERNHKGCSAGSIS
jgi:hypothetical protein